MGFKCKFTFSINQITLNTENQMILTHIVTKEAADSAESSARRDPGEEQGNSHQVDSSDPDYSGMSATFPSTLYETIQDLAHTSLVAAEVRGAELEEPPAEYDEIYARYSEQVRKHGLAMTNEERVYGITSVDYMPTAKVQERFESEIVDFENTIKVKSTNKDTAKLCFTSGMSDTCCVVTIDRDSRQFKDDMRGDIVRKLMPRRQYFVNNNRNCLPDS